MSELKTIRLTYSLLQFHPHAAGSFILIRFLPFPSLSFHVSLNRE